MTDLTAPTDPTLLKREWWRTSFRIWAYILKAQLGPLFMSLLVIMFVFLLQFLMRFIDRIVGKGLDLWTIMQLIAFNLAWMVVLAVPMAVLVACVMAFGAMSSTNELTAMKAAGVSLGRMLFPAILLGTSLAYFDLWFNNNVLPDANHQAKDLMSDIQRKKPTFAIEPGQFSSEDAIPGYSILARTADPNTSELEWVTIYDHSNPQENRVLTARRAQVAFTRDFKNIILTLKSGELHQYSTIQPADYRRGDFKTYVVQVPTNGFDFMRQGESERGDRELSAIDLMAKVRHRDTSYEKARQSMLMHLTQFSKEILDVNKLHGGPGVTQKDLVRNDFQSKFFTIQNDVQSLKQIEEDRDAFLVEVHKKYAIPFACIIFVLIGAPLGALARRGGIGVGVGMSIGFFVLYWIFLIGGEKLADRDVITPFWGMWGGNLLLLLFGVYLVWRVSQGSSGFRLPKLTRMLRVKKLEPQSS